MIAIGFRFPAGRYHANPWGRHVNEGAVEWPPSPWRILRALIATWKRTLPGLSQEQVEPIFRGLANSLPVFVLPPASTGHTRHYMPWFKKGPEDRTLIFDTFVVVPRDSQLVVRWEQMSLDGLQREVLARILTNVNCLGRAESWCEATLLDETYLKAADGHAIVEPLNAREPEVGQEIVRLLCADSATAFGDDYVVTVAARTSGRGKNKQTIKQKVTLYDPAWNICMETLQLHKERWSDPPGSRWVAYTRPRECFKIEPPKRQRHQSLMQSRPQVVRFVLDSAVLPLVTETLPIAEAARSAAMSWHGRLTEKNGDPGRSEALSGKNERGEPLTGHQHSYYLPTDEDGDGRLDHLTVYSANGFGPAEQSAFSRLRILRTGRRGEDRHPIRLLLLGLGTSREFQIGPLQEARDWISATPYLATRHAKTRGRYRIDLGSPEARAAFLENDFRVQLLSVRPDFVSDGTPDVIFLWDDNWVFKVAGRWRTIQFKRFRRKAGDDGDRRLAGAFRLRFRRPVVGPITLGWSSHFGMGLFMPSKQESIE